MKSKKIGNGRWVLGDCLEAMAKLPDNCIDLILCDLPYGTTKNKWDSVIPFKPLWEQYNRICKGPVILTASQPFTSVLVCSNIENFKHEWIWIKNRGSNFANTVREPFKEHESVLVFCKSKWTYNKQMQPRTGAGLDRVAYKVVAKAKSDNYRDFKSEKELDLSDLRVPSSWQKFNTATGKDKFHPTQKPVALFEYLIKTYSNEGELILDNCAGSGTTAIACENLNRRWLCIEKDKDYSNKALNRIRQHLKEIKDAK